MDVGIKIDAKRHWDLKKRKGKVRCVPSPPPPPTPSRLGPFLFTIIESVSPAIKIE